jgi:hypothetical protein
MTVLKSILSPTSLLPTRQNEHEADIRAFRCIHALRRRASGCSESPSATAIRDDTATDRRFKRGELDTLEQMRQADPTVGRRMNIGSAIATASSENSRQ